MGLALLVCFGTRRLKGLRKPWLMTVYYTVTAVCRKVKPLFEFGELVCGSSKENMNALTTKYVKG